MMALNWKKSFRCLASEKRSSTRDFAKFVCHRDESYPLCLRFCVFGFGLACRQNARSPSMKRSICAHWIIGGHVDHVFSCGRFFPLCHHELINGVELSNG